MKCMKVNKILHCKIKMYSRRKVFSKTIYMYVSRKGDKKDLLKIVPGKKLCFVLYTLYIDLIVS